MNLSYDVAVIQWITSCHKKRMTTRVITLWHEHVTSGTASVSTMHFLAEIMLILKAIKSNFKGHMLKRILYSWSFHMKLPLMLNLRYQLHGDTKKTKTREKSKG